MFKLPKFIQPDFYTGKVCKGARRGSGGRAGG